MPPRTRALVVIGLVAAFAFGVGIGRVPAVKPRVSLSPPDNRAIGGLPSPVNAERIQELWDVLHEKFAGTLDDVQLAAGALRGIAAGTDDPYTAYDDPTESAQFAEEINGSFSGIGVEIGLRRGLVTVIAPLRGSPAEKAGIRAQDIILKIDGTDVENRPILSKVVSKIRGRSATTVRLTVAREGQRAPLEFTISRERIALESVTSEVRDGVGIITLSAFHEDTPRRFRKIVRDLLAGRVRGIVVDVRNNPGGILDASVEIAGHFVPANTPVVQEAPREGKERTERRASGPSDLLNVPTVVLINGGSASAAEILAGALNEARDIPLVGETTFGKGSVQEVVELSDGATVRVTVAKWLTGKGIEITEDGILPTVEVKDDKPDQDPDEILEKGISVLRERLRTAR